MKSTRPGCPDATGQRHRPNIKVVKTADEEVDCAYLYYMTVGVNE